MSTSWVSKADGISTNSRRSSAGFDFVEARTRLVHENDLRPADQGLGDLDHAAFEQIKLTAKHSAAFAQADEIERRSDLAPGAGVVGRDMVGDGLNIFHRRQFVDDEFLLKRTAQPQTDAAAAATVRAALRR